MSKNPIQMYRNMSPAVRTSVWFTLCNFLQRGTALITVPIFTRLLTTEEYGICNVYFAWFEIFVLFTSLKLPYEGLNNGLIRCESDKDRYASSIAGLICALTLTAAGIYLPLRHWIDRITGLSPQLMGFMLLMVLFNPALSLWTNRERFDFRYRWPVAVTLVSTILNPVIAVAAVLNTPYKAEARILGTVLVQSVFGLICYIILFRRGKTFYRREYWRFGLTFNLPLLFYYLSQTLLNQSDRLMINYFAGSGKAGIYSVAYSAGTLILLLVSAVNGSLSPWIYKKLKAGCEGEIGGAAFSVSLIVAAAAVGMTAFAPDLIRVLATERYYEAVWIVPPVSASVFFVFLYMLFANIEMYYGEIHYISLISIIGGAVNVVLNGIFIPLFGYLAAGWTTLISYMLLAGLHWMLMHLACRKNGVQNGILYEKQLLVLSAAVAALSFFMLWTYTLGSLRYLVLAAELILLAAFRRQLLDAWKRIQKKPKG